MFEKVFYKDMDKKEWDNFVLKNSFGGFEHTSDFMDSWEIANDSICEHFRENLSFAIRDEKEILAIFNLFKYHSKKDKKIFNVKYCTKHKYSFVSESGFVPKDGLGHKYYNKIARFAIEILDQLVDTYKVKSFSAGMSFYAPAVLPNPSIPLYNPFIYWGFKGTMSTMSVINLQNKNGSEIFKNYSETTKQDIKKIINDSSYKIREAQATQADLDVFYELHKKTYNRTGAIPFDRVLYEKYFFEIMPKGRCRIIFLEQNNKVIACNITCNYKNNYLYHANASAPDQLPGVNKILLHNQILYALEKNGLFFAIGSLFPYERSGKLKGLTDFKSGWGGEVCTRYTGEYFQTYKHKK